MANLRDTIDGINEKAWEAAMAGTSRRRLLYRVNYGNGQVEYPRATIRGLKAACLTYIAGMGEGQAFAFVEFQDPDTGEWFPCGNNHKAR